MRTRSHWGHVRTHLSYRNCHRAPVRARLPITTRYHRLGADACLGWGRRGSPRRRGTPRSACPHLRDVRTPSLANAPPFARALPTRHSFPQHPRDGPPRTSPSIARMLRIPIGGLGHLGVPRPSTYLARGQRPVPWPAGRSRSRCPLAQQARTRPLAEPPRAVQAPRRRRGGGSRVVGSCRPGPPLAPSTELGSPRLPPAPGSDRVNGAPGPKSGDAPERVENVR